MKKYYKDIKATIILMLILSIIGGTFYISTRATHEDVVLVFWIITILCGVGLLFAVWKLIRIIID